MNHRKKSVSVYITLAALLCVGLAHLANAASGSVYVVCCVTSTAVSPAEIDLSWPATPDGWGITGYRIEREFPVGGGFTIIVAKTTSTATTYADKNLSAGVTYNYRISAITGDGVSPSSQGLAAATTPNAPIPIPPGRIQNLTARVGSGSEIDLVWTAPDTGGAAITGYKIERASATTGGFTTIVANTSSTATTYADINLPGGTTYDYRVSAINTYGISYYASSPASATTAMPSSAPQGATAAAGDGQATVSWLAPLIPGGDITGYTVTGTPTSSASVGSSTLNVVVTGLTNGVSYSFSVSALNKAGRGVAAITNAITPGTTPPVQAAASSSPAAVAPSSIPQSSQARQDQLNQLNTLQAALQTLLVRQAAEKSATVPPANAQPSAALDFEFSRNLTLGSSGDDVKALQVFLIKQNRGPRAKKLAAYGANGHFGLLTKNALAEYQKSIFVSPAAGNFGPKTRAYLNSLLPSFGL